VDEQKYTTLMEGLKDVPDPRHPRGMRYPWLFLLALICCAVASGQSTGHGIAHWISLRGVEFLEKLKPPHRCIPSESTIRRVLKIMDVHALEERLAIYAQGLAERVRENNPITTRSGERLRGIALDGKELRGVRAHGQPLCLMSAVQHDNGIVLAQTAVSQKTNEITAAPRLLAKCCLEGTVTTVDALLAQRHLAQQIVEQKRHYLMVIKENQRESYESIALLFDCPPWSKQERAEQYRVHSSYSKAHGRLETRSLESSTTLCGYLNWPEMGQVLRRRCKRVLLRTGEVSEQTTYAVTSLSPRDVDVTQIEALWRGHWAIENRLHYVRDVTMREDAGQIHTGRAPQVLAALRNAIISSLRARGWTNISDAIRYYGASVHHALELIGALPT